MMPPTSIDGTDITGATIDGTDVTEITVDGQTVFSAGPDIPNSIINNTVHLFDARELSFSNGQTVSTWQDEIGSADLSAIDNPTFNTSGINGNPSVTYDGINDGHLASTIDSTANPTTVVAVFQSNDTGTGRRNVYTLDPSDGSSYLQWFDTEWFAWNGGGISGSTDGTIQLASVIFDSSGVIREEGTETVSGSTGTRDRDGIALGGDVGFSSGPRRHWDGEIGLLRIIDGTVPESDLAQYENILLNEWNI